MTDGWSPADPAPPHEGPVAIEVPLTGGADPVPEPSPDDDNRSTRRGPIVVAAILGLLAGAGVAAQLVGGDDDEAATPATEVDELAARITTPPTLGPLDTLPTPDDPALAREPLDEGPQPTSSQDRSLFDGVTRPIYPDVTDVGLPDLIGYDIGAAVDRLGDDVPRRSETHLELGTAGFVLDVTIERDPERDRFRILLESGGDSQEAVVDVATGTTYVRSGDEFVADIPNEELIAGTTASDVTEYFDRLLLGPVRPDSFDAAATRGRGAVTIDDVRVARQFIANVQGSLIPEWQLYAFSPVFEFPVEDRPSLLEYAVYVDGGGDIVQVDGVSLVGDVPQLVEHKLTRLDAPIEVELPADVTDPTVPTVPTPTSDPDDG